MQEIFLANLQTTQTLVQYTQFTATELNWKSFIGNSNEHLSLYLRRAPISKVRAGIGDYEISKDVLKRNI